MKGCFSRHRCQVLEGQLLLMSQAGAVGPGADLVNNLPLCHCSRNLSHFISQLKLRFPKQRVRCDENAVGIVVVIDAALNPPDVLKILEVVERQRTQLRFPRSSPLEGLWGCTQGICYHHPCRRRTSLIDNQPTPTPSPT